MQCRTQQCRAAVAYRLDALCDLLDSAAIAACWYKEYRTSTALTVHLDRSLYNTVEI